MANKKTQYRNITHIPGKIIVNLPNGTKKTFKNSSEAQKFFEDNYGKGYVMEITSTEDGNGEVTINGGELPEVTVVGQAPKKKPKSDTDRPAFNPHERRGVDKWIGANYSPRFDRASAKLGVNPLNWTTYIDPSYWDSETHRNVVKGGNIAAGIVTAPFAAVAAAETAPTLAPWLSQKAMPFVAKHFIAPTVAGTIWDNIQRAITGTTTTEQISNYLQGKGWNPIVSEFVGGLTNPGYWINFGGTGRYTRPLFNKIGLGLPNSSTPIELSPTIQANINALMPKSKLRTKVLDPTLQWIDRNLYRFQAATSPWLLRYKPVTAQVEDLPRFRFVSDPSKLQGISQYTENEGSAGQVWDYLLFRSAPNNQRVFGKAMELKLPEFNKTTFYKEGITKRGIADQLISPFAAGLSATDIALSNSEDRSPWLRVLEYAALGRYGLNKLIRGRIQNVLGQRSNYLNNFAQTTYDINNFFRKNPIPNQPAGYTWYWNNGLNAGRMYVKQGTHQPTVKPGFNYKNASFDDLIRFLEANGKRKPELDGFTIDANKLYSPSGQVIAERTANGKIKLFNEQELRNILSKDIDIVNYATGNRYRGKISVDDNGTVIIPEEYINTLRSNIDYVQNTLFPGSGIKVFGSSAGVTEAGFPHATHDIDFYITQNQINKLLQSGMLKESDKINSGTYTYRLNPAQFGEQGNIDLNVLEQTPEGMATGIRAEELFRQYFPDDYFKALREFKARQANRDPTASSIVINKTPEELLEAMNPSSKTIMDSFDIDFTDPAKSKHALRSWAHLVYSDPQQVSQGINQYAKSMLGSRVTLFPITLEQLGDRELNLQALKKLGINLRNFELERIASDPQRMKNVLDAWYMMDNTAMRYIRGTWPGTTGYSPENFVRSATIWDPVNNGGNSYGAGLNTTIGGDSGYSGDLKAFISPNTQYKSTNLLDLIDEINYNFGRHPDAPRILSRIPSYGDEAVRQLQQVYDERGWNFLQNRNSYTFNGPDKYASATRPFDIDRDFVGFAPTKIKLNALIPRINVTEQRNPLAEIGYKAPFTFRREIPAQPDYYYTRTSSLSPVFQANRDRYWTSYPNPLNKIVGSDFIPWKQEVFFGGALPIVIGTGYGITSYNNDRKRNWLQNAINSPDEIILGMPEEDRNKFTQQGVDSLREASKQEFQKWNTDYDDSDLDNAIYYNLRNIYDKYSSQEKDQNNEKD